MHFQKLLFLASFAVFVGVASPVVLLDPNTALTLGLVTVNPSLAAVTAGGLLLGAGLGVGLGAAKLGAVTAFRSKRPRHSSGHRYGPSATHSAGRFLSSFLPRGLFNKGRGSTGYRTGTGHKSHGSRRPHHQQQQHYHRKADSVTSYTSYRRKRTVPEAITDKDNLDVLSNSIGDLLDLDTDCSLLLACELATFSGAPDVSEDLPLILFLMKPRKTLDSLDFVKNLHFEPLRRAAALGYSSKDPALCVRTFDKCTYSVPQIKDVLQLNGFTVGT